jgi:hypothetical protein
VLRFSFFGGYFNVPADEPDPSVVNWALMKIRMASIGRRARDNSPVDLDSLDVVRASARVIGHRREFGYRFLQVTCL